MSSLWTPGGEHQVSPNAPAPGPQDGEQRTSGLGGGDDEELAAREELAALERELLKVPAADIVANHCYGLFQLAAIHLGQQPPGLGEAQVAIDALGALVEQLGDRLGEAAPTLVEALAQLRLAYVQLAAPSQAAGEGDQP